MSLAARTFLVLLSAGAAWADLSIITVQVGLSLEVVGLNTCDITLCT